MPIHELKTADDRAVVIRHSNGAVAFRDIRDVVAAAAVGASAPELPLRWQEAMAEQQMSIDQSIVPEVVDNAAAKAQLEEDDSKIEIAAQPPADHTLLLAVQVGDVLQWYVPVNASRLLPVHANVLREGDIVTVPDRALRFRVPTALVASPTAVRSAAMTGGSLGVVMHLIRIPIVRDLVDAPISVIIKFIVDHVDKKPEGFRFLDGAKRSRILTEADLRPMRDQRVLLLVHGIFSSVDAFTEIADGPVMAHLRGIYGDNIIGWDHRTVAKGPFENADDMLSALPPGIQPDVICHSRGALVMRAALEHVALQAKRQTRFASVGTALFVAGANQGSQLATFQHINDLLNVYSAVASIPVLGSVGVALGIIVGVLKVLAHGASIIPAVKALSTDSDNRFVQDLDQPFHTKIGQLVIARANYDPRANDLVMEALNLNVDKIFATANDLVVPYDGASRFDEDVRIDADCPFGTEERSQSIVMHTNFFAQPEIHQLIIDRFRQIAAIATV